MANYRRCPSPAKRESFLYPYQGLDLWGNDTGAKAYIEGFLQKRTQKLSTCLVSQSLSRKGRGLSVPCKNVANKAKGKLKKYGICSLVYVIDTREPGIVNVCIFPFL
ncbi:hypothetical protein GOP47_0012332 [Adiantum capillus-veneris]|uniref:Uncharacterized protein n=1 Tax=Adiantum capillus-veneris TaxID=13818 RepID=A0A9D4UR67_ADICA|nr:hypothetical protein GOP47_0012332 [Adiantum capillus-veneris]